MYIVHEAIGTHIHYKSIRSDGIKPVQYTVHHNLEFVTLVTEPKACFIPLLHIMV